MSVKIQWNKGDVFMDKIKVMLIVNPCAGKKYGEKISDKVAELFRTEGAQCDLFLTEHPGDGTKFVLSHGRAYDIIACMGGDGTLNEVINGILKSHLDIPLGYIPAGSTNDFANSMHLSKEPQQAVKDILACHTETIDAGRFDDRYFSYVASFGAFTRSSYSTPQNLKNMLGRFSYFLEGAKDLGEIHSEHMTVQTDSQTFEGDYAFGAISNSTTIGGLVKYDSKDVNVSDEKLEMLLIRMPGSLADLLSVVHSITHKDYLGSPYIDFCRADRFAIHSDRETDWSLDGEFAHSPGNSVVSCVKNKINFIKPKYI